jgi:hypothetical protein
MVKVYKELARLVKTLLFLWTYLKVVALKLEPMMIGSGMQEEETLVL